MIGTNKMLIDEEEGIRMSRASLPFLPSSSFQTTHSSFTATLHYAFSLPITTTFPVHSRNAGTEPDTMARGVEMPRSYTVQTIDPSKVSDAEAQLKRSFDPYDVVLEHLNNDVAR
jgi:hypothetical protein